MKLSHQEAAEWMTAANLTLPINPAQNPGAQEKDFAYFYCNI